MFNFFKPKIVQFKDGSYAIRRFNYDLDVFRYEYLDIENFHWWSINAYKNYYLFFHIEDIENRLRRHIAHESLAKANKKNRNTKKVKTTIDYGTPVK